MAGLVNVIVIIWRCVFGTVQSKAGKGATGRAEGSCLSVARVSCGLEQGRERLGNKRKREHGSGVWVWDPRKGGRRATKTERRPAVRRLIHSKQPAWQPDYTYLPT
jgi:hypothetical protein